MATTFTGWGGSWGAAWDGTPDPNAMRGAATLRLSAAGTLTAATLDGSMSGAASFSLGAAGTLSVATPGACPLSPLAIAVQGIGFDPIVVATQGLEPICPGDNPQVPPGGGIALYSGRIFAYRERPAPRRADDDEIVVAFIQALYSSGFFEETA